MKIFIVVIIVILLGIIHLGIEVPKKDPIKLQKFIVMIDSQYIEFYGIADSTKINKGKIRIVQDFNNKNWNNVIVLKENKVGIY